MVHLFHIYADHVHPRLIAKKKHFGAAHALPLLASGFIYRMQDGGLV